MDLIHLKTLALHAKLQILINIEAWMEIPL